MKHFIYLTFLFILNIPNIVHSITFNTTKLQDSSSVNYIEFNSKYIQCSSASEKIVADFNNDDYLDVLSLGGANNCHPDYTDTNLPLELNLYDAGDYIYQDTNIPYGSKHVNVVDIDNDNDLDIVMSNGKIGVNDGQAKFTTVTYDAINPDLDYFFSFDWNQDGLIDIVTLDSIYLNEVGLSFNKIENSNALNSDYYAVANLDADGVPDMLVVNNGQLHSWINNGKGQLSLLTSLNLDINYTKIKAIDLNSDGADELVISNTTGDVESLRLINNDGHGNLSLNDFEFPQLASINSLTLKIVKIYSQDADNDGDEDLWISTTFTTDDINCNNNHNLLLIYENTNDGQLSYRNSLHVIGFVQQESTFPFFTPTDQSYPTIIDLNQDNLADVIMLGEKNVTWLQVSPYEFELSNSSSLQFNNHIQALDYNKDGNVDIFSSGMYSETDTRCHQQPLGNPENTLSTTTTIAKGKLWLGDGKGEFTPLSSEDTTSFDFNVPYDNAQLVDLNQDGDFELLYKSKEPDFTTPQFYYQESANHTPELITPANSFVQQLEMADLDNDGIMEFIILKPVGPKTNTLKIIKKTASGFVESEIITLVLIDSFKLEDMDNDGNIDIVLNLPIVLYNDLNSLLVFYNIGSGTFTYGGSYAEDVNQFSISDINGDGLLDVMVSNYIGEVEILLNQGQRNFIQSDYDNSFWHLEASDYIRFDSSVIGGLVPEKSEFKDINNDGKEDLFVYNNTDNGYLQIYINESNENEISFYKAYSVSYAGQYIDSGSHGYNIFTKSNIAIADFNNDGLLDFANGNHDNIKINTQKSIDVATGLYYDPTRNGHGFSIEDLGRDNLFYSLFYSYDENGKPEWYSVLNRFRGRDDFWILGNVSINQLLYSTYNYETNTASLEEISEDESSINFFKYLNESNIIPIIDIDPDRILWSMNKLISEGHAPDEDLSGIWWAGEQDSGWGISVEFLQTGNTESIVAILYFYDENGTPRWLIGQADGFELNQDITLNINQINGYGRNQNFVELTQIPAGTITFNLNQASKDFSNAGTMSMDVLYPEDQTNNNYWVRDNIPIALFTKPRD